MPRFRPSQSETHRPLARLPSDRRDSTLAQDRSARRLCCAPPPSCDDEPSTPAIHIDIFIVIVIVSSIGGSEAEECLSMPDLIGRPQIYTTPGCGAGQYMCTHRDVAVQSLRWRCVAYVYTTTHTIISNPNQSSASCCPVANWVQSCHR